MSASTDTWLGSLLGANAAFRRGADPARLPVARSPGRRALVTCMDPRVNLAALGVEPFDANGAGGSDVRVVRTIGAVAEDRSLLVGIHLAGIGEIAVVTHTDCGNALAKQRVEAIAASLEARMRPPAYEAFRARVGEPFAEQLVRWLRAFDDPYAAVREEVARIRSNPLVPDGTVVHGLVYDLAAARLDLVLDGYEDLLSDPLSQK